MSTVAKSLFAPVTELWDEPKSATLRAIEDTKSQNQNSSETPTDESKGQSFFIVAAETVQQSQSQDQQNFVTKASSSNTNNVEEMQRIINELSAELEASKGRLLAVTEVSARDLSRIQEQLRDMQTKIGTLESDKERANSEIVSLKNMLAIAHADIEGFSKEREGLRAQIRQLKEKQNETVRMSMSDSSMLSSPESVADPLPWSPSVSPVKAKRRTSQVADRSSIYANENCKVNPKEDIWWEQRKSDKTLDIVLQKEKAHIPKLEVSSKLHSPTSAFKNSTREKYAAESITPFCTRKASSVFSFAGSSSSSSSSSSPTSKAKDGNAKRASVTVSKKGHDSENCNS